MLRNELNTVAALLEVPVVEIAARPTNYTPRAKTRISKVSVRVQFSNRRKLGLKYYENGGEIVRWKHTALLFERFWVQIPVSTNIRSEVG